MQNETKLHPFEAAGMGRGPYAYAGFFDLAEARDPNSAANFGNPTGGMEDAPKLRNGLGCCAHCGMGIMNICIVVDADGGLWGVGCDCIEKADEPALSDKAKIDIANKARRKRQAKAEASRVARQEAWFARVNPATGETNAARLAREDQERAAALVEAVAVKATRAEKLRDILEPLGRIANPDPATMGWAAKPNEFMASMAAQLAERALSERQAECVAKALFGRRTKANAAEFDAALDRMTEK